MWQMLASAATIAYPSIALPEFAGPAVKATASGVIVPTGPVDYFVVGGTACYQGFCPGESPASPGPVFTVGDPLALRLDGIQVACWSPTLGACGGQINITWTFDLISAVNPYSVDVALAGTTVNNFPGLSAVVTVNGLASPFITVVVDGNGAFDTTFKAGLTDIASRAAVNLSLQIASLGSTKAITMP